MYSKEKCTITCVVWRRRNGASLFLWQWKELQHPKSWEKTLSNLCQLLTTHTVHEGPNHATETWKKDFFPLFVYLFLPSAFHVLLFLLFLASFRIFPSAFSHSHPPSAGIRSASYRLDCEQSLMFFAKLLHAKPSTRRGLQSRWMRHFTERKGGLQEVYLQTPLLNLIAANNVLTRELPVDQIYKRLSL